MATASPSFASETDTLSLTLSLHLEYLEQALSERQRVPYNPKSWDSTDYPLHPSKYGCTNSCCVAGGGAGGGAMGTYANYSSYPSLPATSAFYGVGSSALDSADREDETLALQLQIEDVRRDLRDVAGERQGQDLGTYIERLGERSKNNNSEVPSQTYVPYSPTSPSFGASGSASTGGSSAESGGGFGGKYFDPRSTVPFFGHEAPRVPSPDVDFFKNYYLSSMKFQPQKSKLPATFKANIPSSSKTSNNPPARKSSQPLNHVPPSSSTSSSASPKLQDADTEELESQILSGFNPWENPPPILTPSSSSSTASPASNTPRQGKAKALEAANTPRERIDALNTEIESDTFSIVAECLSPPRADGHDTSSLPPSLTCPPKNTVKYPQLPLLYSSSSGSSKQKFARLDSNLQPQASVVSFSSSPSSSKPKQTRLDSSTPHRKIVPSPGPNGKVSGIIDAKGRREVIPRRKPLAVRDDDGGKIHDSPGFRDDIWNLHIAGKGGVKINTSEKSPQKPRMALKANDSSGSRQSSEEFANMFDFGASSQPPSPREEEMVLFKGRSSSVDRKGKSVEIVSDPVLSLPVDKNDDENDRVPLTPGIGRTTKLPILHTSRRGKGGVNVGSRGGRGVSRKDISGSRAEVNHLQEHNKEIQAEAEILKNSIEIQLQKRQPGISWEASQKATTKGEASSSSSSNSNSKGTETAAPMLAIHRSSPRNLTHGRPTVVVSNDIERGVPNNSAEPTAQTSPGQSSSSRRSGFLAVPTSARLESPFSVVIPNQVASSSRNSRTSFVAPVAAVQVPDPIVETPVPEAPEEDDSFKLNCAVCMEDFDVGLMVQTPDCMHIYCNQCVKDMFIRALASPATSIPVRCCRSPVPISLVESLLSTEEVLRYIKLEHEYTMPTQERVYCFRPYCAEFIPLEGIKGDMAVCGKCGGGTCKHCAREWHEGLCPQDKETEKVLEEGRQKGWSRCPQCKHLVEKTEGCLHITCYCRFEFCYSCTKPWASCNGRCPRRHRDHR